MKIPALTLRFPPGAGPAGRDLATAALLDFDTAAVHEIGDDEWRVFFRTGDERDRAAATLRGLAETTAIDLDAEDWARKSQEGLRAIAVGGLIVAPPWDVPETGHVVVIEPSTGFGTAHHATTRLCLRALQRVPVAGRHVLDVGTGSGVLAIAAARLGARAVAAIDDDPDAIQAAGENVTRNGVTVDLRNGDFRDPGRCAPADVVLANLTGAMLERGARDLAALARGGTLIVSGLLEEEASAIREAFAAFTSEIRRDDEDGWVAFTFTVP